MSVSVIELLIDITRGICQGFWVTEKRHICIIQKCFSQWFWAFFFKATNPLSQWYFSVAFSYIPIRPGYLN